MSEEQILHHAAGVTFLNKLGISAQTGFKAPPSVVGDLISERTVVTMARQQVAAVYTPVAIKVKQRPYWSWSRTLGWDTFRRFRRVELLSLFCREELLLLKEESDKKVRGLEGQCVELQSVLQQVSDDFQKVSGDNTPLHVL